MLLKKYAQDEDEVRPDVEPAAAADAESRTDDAEDGGVESASSASKQPHPPASPTSSSPSVASKSVLKKTAPSSSVISSGAPWHD